MPLCMIHRAKFKVITIVCYMYIITRINWQQFVITTAIRAQIMKLKQIISEE